MTALAVIFAFLGFLMLALSMNRHHRQLFGTPLSRRRRLLGQSLGAGLLCAALACCLTDFGWPIGVVAWAGLLSVGGILTVGFVTLASRHP